MKLSPTALCLSRTWPGPGLSTLICCQIRTSGPPVFSKRIACTMIYLPEFGGRVLEAKGEKAKLFRLDQCRFRCQRAFELQQGALCVQAAGTAIAAHPAFAQHPVAWDDHRDRVAAAGTADRARRRPDRGGEVAVAAGFAIRNVLHRRPNTLLERGASWTQR